MTTRSGRMKSSIADPSRRNSGLEATSNVPSARRRATIRRTSSQVTTGTVDLVTMTAWASPSAPAMSSAAR